MVLGGFEFTEILHTAEPIVAGVYQSRRTICVSPLKETEQRDVHEIYCISKKGIITDSSFAFTCLHFEVFLLLRMGAPGKIHSLTVDAHIFFSEFLIFYLCYLKPGSLSNNYKMALEER